MLSLNKLKRETVCFIQFQKQVKGVADTCIHAPSYTQRLRELATTLQQTHKLRDCSYICDSLSLHAARMHAGMATGKVQDRWRTDRGQ